MESCGDEDKGGEAMLFENSGDYSTLDSVVNPLYQSDNKSYISYIVEGTIGPYNIMKDMAVRILSNYYMIMNLADERVSDWPLMRNPAPTILITITYVLICRVGSRCLSQDFSGGKFLGMSNSILQLILIAHNTLLIILNAHIMMRLWEPCTRYKIQCQPVDYSNDPVALASASGLWFFYISKMVEMMDSIFLLMKGKTGQLSFLHIYHHSSMFCLWWIGVKFVPGGSAVFGAFVNSIVHVIMYTYYLISALGPRFRKYLRWKKYLTLIQMCQFLAAVVMGINGLHIKCSFPLWMIYAMIFYMISFIALFGNFYYHTYLLKSKGN